MLKFKKHLKRTMSANLEILISKSRGQYRDRDQPRLGGQSRNRDEFESLAVPWKIGKRWEKN